MTLYQIDAFTDKLFGGNPAGVIVLDAWPSDQLMQSIALENNLAETAFIIPEGDDLEFAGLRRLWKWIYADMQHLPQLLSCLLN